MSKKASKYLIESGIAIILIIGFVLINKQIDKRQAILNENVSDYKFHSDLVKVKDGILVLSGWCYRYNTDTPSLGTEQADNFTVVLFDENAELNTVEDLDKASVYADTVRIERPDVYENYGEKEGYQYDYTYSGYEASIEMSKIDIQNHDYVLAFRYGDKDNHLIRTKVHLNEVIK